MRILGGLDNLLFQHQKHRERSQDETIHMSGIDALIGNLIVKKYVMMYIKYLGIYWNEIFSKPFVESNRSFVIDS